MRLRRTCETHGHDRGRGRGRGHAAQQFTQALSRVAKSHLGNNERD